MKISVANKILSFVAIFLSLVAAASFFPQIKNRNAPRQMTTALLNPNYADTISEIIITTVDKTLTFRKISGRWTGEQGSLIFPVAEERVVRLIDALKKIRKMQSSPSKKNFYDDNTSIIYALQDSRHEADKAERSSTDCTNNIRYIKINFFNQTSVSNRRLLFLENDFDIYETEDDFRDFLTSSANSWAEPFLVSRAVFGNVSAIDIQYISFDGTQSTNAKTSEPKSISPDTQKFKNAAAKILQLRHGGVCEMPKISDITKIFSSLTLGKGDGTFLRLFFLPQQDGSFIVMHFVSDDFATLASTIPQTLSHGGHITDASEVHVEQKKSFANELQSENTSAACKYNFAVRISGWTYDNVLALFD